MKRVVVVPPSGIPVTPDPYVTEIDETRELDELQRLVGGWIEYVPCEAPVTVYCNEEGKIQGLSPNFKATHAFGGWLHPGDIIAGQVVVMGPIDETGENMSLSDDDAEYVLGMVT